METPIEILNNIAKENGEIDFYNLLNNACWHNDYTEKKDFIKQVEKAMQLYAEQYAYHKCEEQKEAVAKYVTDEYISKGHFFDKEYVYDTPNVCNPKTN